MATNIWNPLGIRSTPFFQDALDLSAASVRPISLFVGRSSEAESVQQRIVGGESSRIVVAGLPGAGKTTFIQYVKSQLADQGYAVSSEFCRVPHQLSFSALGVELLRSVVRSLRNAPSVERPERLDGFEDARTLVEETQHRTWQASLSVLGTGVGAGAGRQARPPAFSSDQFYGALTRLLASARTAGVPGVVVHLNSLENLGRDPAGSSVLFRDARDYFLVVGLHLLLGAALDFYGSVIATYAQVRSIFPTPTRLEPMGLADVRSLLEKRYAHLRIEGMEVTPPVTRDLVKELHGLFLGDLRGMLSALEEACYLALGSTRSAPLDRDQSIPVLAPLYQQELSEALTASELKHLERLAVQAGAEFRQSDVLDHLGLSAGRVSTLFGSLERAQAVVHVRSDGRSRYYALSGRTRIAFGKT